MSTLVTRAGKGSPLTHNEVDANFTNLNTDKIQSGNTVAALTITALTTPSVQAVNSAGLALKNSAGTTQMSMGAGGGDNMAINVSTNLNGTNAQIDISPTGTGHVHIKPTGVNSVEIAPTYIGEMDNITIGGTTAAAATVTSLTIGTTQLGAGNASIMKNRIINGSQVINQRNQTITLDTSGAYMTDRWSQNNGGSAVMTGGQSATSQPNGSQYSLQITTTTGASPSAGNLVEIVQHIEGYNVADLWYGTSSAQTTTVSFWVKSSLTGTFCVAIGNASYNRSYVTTYTINTANTWEYKTVTITGDQSGTWGITNGAGVSLYFDMGSGSNFNTTANSWTSGFYTRVSGATSLSATTGATFNITAVQLEVGSSATGFEYENYTSLLSKCQRYYQVIPRLSWNQGQANRDTATQSYHGQMLISQMRVAPTVAGFNTSGNTSTSATRYGPNGEFEQINWTTALTSTFNISTQSFAFLTTFAGATTFEPKALVTVNNAGFTMSAEL
jgi:hypothetical protein